MSRSEAPNISANAGDPAALNDPNSPESISRRAKQAQAQSAEDQVYDAPPPPPPEQFLDYIVVFEDERKRSKEITAGVFLALGVLLFLYKAAPDSL